MPSAPRARIRLLLVSPASSPTPVLGRARTWPPLPPPPPALPPPAFPAGALPPPPDGAVAAPGQTVSPIAIALPALPPLLMSWMETAPPLAATSATPPLPELAVSVCIKRCSSTSSGCADQSLRLLWRPLPLSSCRLLLPFPLSSWLLFPLPLWSLLLWLPLPLPLSVAVSLPPSAVSARLPLPPLESPMAVPPSATTSRTVSFRTVPPLTATQRSLPRPCAASAPEAVTTPRFNTTTAAVAIEKNRALPMVHSPSILRVSSARSRPTPVCRTRSGR